MELSRLAFSLAALDAVPDVVAASSAPVVLECLDGDVAVAIGALADRLTGPVGVWLEVTEGYPAALAARDVATLSWLVDLEHVVVAASSDAGAHARVLAALLTNDEVNLESAVATLRGAYNRPAPPRPVTVWTFDDGSLVEGARRLRARARETTRAGELTPFAAS